MSQGRVQRVLRCHITDVANVKVNLMRLRLSRRGRTKRNSGCEALTSLSLSSIPLSVLPSLFIPLRSVSSLFLASTTNCLSLLQNRSFFSRQNRMRIRFDGKLKPPSWSSFQRVRPPSEAHLRYVNSQHQHLHFISVKPSCRGYQSCPAVLSLLNM